jgi:hypothetical protein
MHGSQEKYIYNFGQKSKWKITSGKYRYICDDIKLDLRGVGCEGVDWVYLAQSRRTVLARTRCEHYRKTSIYKQKLFSSLVPVDCQEVLCLVMCLVTGYQHLL